MQGSILTVENQYHFRKGLRRHIETNQPNWKVIGEAESGQEAIVIIDQLKPDLVLTDIRMPGMDGIQLAEYIHKNHKQTLIVMITGYKDFEYAKAALRYEALDYLLKPCSEQEINRVLNKAYDKLKEKKKHLEKVMADTQTTQLLTLRSIFRNLPYDPTHARNLSKKLSGKTFWLVRVDDFMPHTKTYDEKDIQLLQFAISNIINELVHTHGLESLMNWIDHNLYVMFIDPCLVDRELESNIHRTIINILGIPITIKKQNSWKEFKHLAEIYNQLANLSSHQSNDVHFEHNPPIIQTELAEMHSQIYYAIVSGEERSVREFVSNYVSTLNDMELSDAKLKSLKLVIALNKIAEQEFHTMESVSFRTLCLKELHQFKELTKVIEWTRHSMDQFLKHWDTWRSLNSAKYPIEHAIQYIEQRYMERCSLNEIASYVYLHPNYFSNLFKKETGKSYITYLTQIRMEKAKMLLTNTNMKITSIAESVGYDEPTYFTNLFKQHFGMSPSIFRKCNTV